MISVHRVSRSIAVLCFLVLGSALTGHAAEKLGELRDIQWANFNHDGSRVIVWRRGGILQIWESTGGKIVTGDLGLKTAVETYRMSADGKRLVASFADGHSRVFDSTTAKALSPLLDGALRSRLDEAALFSPDGGTLLIFGEKDAAVFNVSTGKRITTIPLAEGNVLEESPGSAAFVAGGAQCFFIDAKGLVTRYDTKDWKPIGKPLDHPAAEHANDYYFTVSEDGKWLATYDGPGENGPKGNLQVWDVDAEKPLGEPLTAHNGLTAQFLGNNRVLIIPERDGVGSVYDVPSMKEVYKLDEHDDIDAPKTAVSPDDKWLLTWALDRRFDLFDAATGKIERRFDNHAKISAVFMAPDSSGCLVAFSNTAFEDQGYHDNYIVKLSFPLLEVTQALRFTETVEHPAFSPDGKRFMLQHGEGDKQRLQVLDAATLKPLK